MTIYEVSEQIAAALGGTKRVNEIEALITTALESADANRAAIGAEPCLDDNDKFIVCAKCKSSILAGEGGYVLNKGQYYHAHACYGFIQEARADAAETALARAFELVAKLPPMHVKGVSCPPAACVACVLQEDIEAILANPVGKSAYDAWLKNAGR